MFTNLIRAKISTHSLTVAIGVMVFFTHRFFSDPNAAAWLHSHWILRDGFETLEATLIAYGLYASPTKPAA